MKGKTPRETRGDAKAVSHCLPPGIWRPVSLSAKAALEKLPPPVLLLNMTLYGLWYVLGQFGSALCPSSFLPTRCVGQSKKQRWSWHCASTFQQQMKHSCCIKAGFVTNQNHRTVRASVKKINCIPTGPRTFLKFMNHTPAILWTLMIYFLFYQSSFIFLRKVMQHFCVYIHLLRGFLKIISYILWDT